MHDSYGNYFSFSPDLVYYSDYAYCIDKRGAVYDNDQYVAEISYGIFFQNNFRSPSRVSGADICHVRSDGVIYNNDGNWVITYSYGKK